MRFPLVCGRHYDELTEVALGECEPVAGSPPPSSPCDATDDSFRQSIEGSRDVNAPATRADLQSILRHASEKGHTDVVAALIAAKTDLNGADVVAALIAAAADPNAANKNGWTPLYAASQNGHTDVVAALIAVKADVNAAENNVWTPLCVASVNKHTDAVAALIAAKADVNAANRNGCTPLFVASEKGHTDAVAALIAAKADVNAANKNGWTPLFVASVNNHTDAVAALVAAKGSQRLGGHLSKTSCVRMDTPMMSNYSRRPAGAQARSGRWFWQR